MSLSLQTILSSSYEGNTEKYILELLLEQEAFKCERWQILDYGRIFKRSNTLHLYALENQYLPMDFGNSQLVVLLIQDDESSPRISEHFLEKITGLLFVVTKPEIEMFMIHSLGLYEDFHWARVQNHQLKPLQFVADHLGVSTSRAKSKTFVLDFYKENVLVEAIHAHSMKANRECNQYFLSDIIE